MAGRICVSTSVPLINRRWIITDYCKGSPPIGRKRTTIDEPQNQPDELSNWDDELQESNVPLRHDAIPDDNNLLERVVIASIAKKDISVSF